MYICVPLCNGRAALVQSLSTVRAIYTTSAPHPSSCTLQKAKNRYLKGVAP